VQLGEDRHKRIIELNLLCGGGQAIVRSSYRRIGRKSEYYFKTGSMLFCMASIRNWPLGQGMEVGAQ
jgi:hypothetical protein